MKHLIVLPLTLIAAACGSLNPFGGTSGSGSSAPARSEPSAQRTTPPPAAKPQGQAPIVQRRGGAYYQDDGPGDNAPPNLEQTPDAIPKDEPVLRSATNRPYVVFGKTYTPFTDERTFSQRGVGSWYGRKFHGQKTSSGEPYDMYAMTAAHPTLPIPSYVRVTNVSNGRSVVVRVNDRGPFHSERIIDLSYTAALKLDYVNQGSTLVEVVRLREGDRTLIAAAPAAGTTPAPKPAPAPAAQTAQQPAPKPVPTNDSRPASAEKPVQSASAASPPASTPPAAQPAPVEPATVALPTTTQPDGVYLQLGAFGARENAESFKARVSQQLNWLTESIYVVAGNNLHRLQVGPYKNRDEANKVAEKIRETMQLKPVFVLK